jgi:hypothetical protein
VSFINNIKLNLASIPGWRTNRKIVVIESDDWGSIRMPSKTVLSRLDIQGYIPQDDFYNRFDSLASENDLSNLFDVLSSVKDRNDRSAVITANTIVANPDFKKIEDSNYQSYFYEKFTDTMKKYPNHGKSFDLWNEGIERGVFHPQFHGRDHVNTTAWLKKLKRNDRLAHTAFKNKLLGLRDAANNQSREYYFMRALDYSDMNDLTFKVKAIEDGLHLFNQIFGYRSKSFIAPSYVWDDSVEKILKFNGVDYIQGIRLQKKPVLNKIELVNKIHFLGNKSSYNQIYLVRNVFFEPSLGYSNQIVENTLNRINTAFKWNKPAIIGSHRINYIGFIDEKNRDQNLVLFQLLLKNIVKKWPDVEFMTSDQLGQLI